MKWFYTTLLLLYLVWIPLEAVFAQSTDRFLVVIDPGHGGTAETDSYRVGPGGEREEWVNLRVSLELKSLLESEGVDVRLTREEDVAVSLRDRGDLAIGESADLFLSIHHNATADPEVNFPIVYYHGSSRENPASVILGRAVICELQRVLHDDDTAMSLVSDKTIFPGSGTAVLRHSEGIPGIIAEASFFTHPPEEKRLKDSDYNRLEAQAYARAILAFREWVDRDGVARQETGLEEISPFKVFQEEDRMRPEAREWREQFERGLELYEAGEWEGALEQLTLSAKAFPDSPVARDAHLYRARSLEKLGKTKEAAMEFRRAREYYVDSKVVCGEPFYETFGIR
ncbi:MAG: N-acetylmuramoyl-L-alanine amidase [Bacteroidota bacterium]